MGPGKVVNVEVRQTYNKEEPEYYYKGDRLTWFYTIGKQGINTKIVMKTETGQEKVFNNASLILNYNNGTY